MHPNFGTDKMLDPRFFGSKSPKLQCPASHFQGLHVLLAAYGIPHGIQDHWSANLGRLWKMFGSSQTSAGSARAPPVHVELRFQKESNKWGVLLLSWISSGEPGFRALPESPVQTHTFLFLKKDNFHLFSLHQTFKSPTKHSIKQCQCWQLPGQQQRVCAHHISHIVQTTPLEVLTSRFKMLKYFTPPFSHCPLSPSPCNHF